jgi:Tol biopolymer transport system component
MARRFAIPFALLALALPATAGAAARNGPIAFAGGDARQATGIWAWKAGWNGLRQITADPTDADPQGSRDGRWIVFTRQGDVFRARTDGSRVMQVTDSGAAFDRAPSFSPSGNRILFSRDEPGPPPDEKLPGVEHIYSVGLDGTGLRQLTTGDFSDRDPAYSPNGRVIAFDRFQVGTGRHVFTMRPDGSRVKDATPFLAAWSREPAFNPTGSRIVYVRGSYGSSTSDLFTIRPDGRKVRRLTGRRGDPLGGVSSPSWSPDGTRVVFQYEPGVKFSKLQIVRVRDRHLGTTLGGRRFAQSPEMRMPAWLSG